MNDALHIRFDDPQVILDLVAQAVENGVNLNELDVILAQFAPVDLDLLHDAIAKYLRGSVATLSVGLAA